MYLDGLPAEGTLPEPREEEVGHAELLTRKSASETYLF